MKRSILSLALAALTGAVGLFQRPAFREATPSKRVRVASSKAGGGKHKHDENPAGSKLARMAREGRVGVKHLGLRVNDLDAARV